MESTAMQQEAICLTCGWMMMCDVGTVHEMAFLRPINERQFSFLFAYFVAFISIAYMFTIGDGVTLDLNDYQCTFYWNYISRFIDCGVKSLFKPASYVMCFQTNVLHKNAILNIKKLKKDRLVE